MELGLQRRRIVGRYIYSAQKELVRNYLGKGSRVGIEMPE